MATSLQVDIVTPDANAFSGEASEVLIPAWEGEMGVYPDHDALLTLLRAGVVQITTSAGVESYLVGRGFAEIGPGSVTLLTNDFQKASEVDKAQADADLKKAEAELAEADFGTEKRKQADIAVEHARARLQA